MAKQAVEAMRRKDSIGVMSGHKARHETLRCNWGFQSLTNP
jgi:hypothetical protein